MKRKTVFIGYFGNRAIPTGLKHGTVTVCCQEGKVETTTFRRDGVYADHRHPEQVTFTRSATRYRQTSFPLTTPYMFRV